MQGVEGIRALVVEDEALLSLELQDLLADLGAVVVGSAASISAAINLAQTVEFDIAVLDVNLGSDRIDKVAELISARGIPIVFATGYVSPDLPPSIKGALIEKPYDIASLKDGLLRALAEQPA